jgi:cytochrome P450
VAGVLPSLSTKAKSAKTQVSLHPYAAHHSSENFVEAETFAPERWMTESGGSAKYAPDDKASLIPFSLGWRNCLGKNLAYAEARSILARMLWNFEMELQPESDNWTEHDVRTLWMKGPLMVKLTQRKDD